MKPDSLGDRKTHFTVVVCLIAFIGVTTHAEEVRGGIATIELVSLATAGPNDITTTLPTSQIFFLLGETFVVEVWAQTSDSAGLSSVSIDIAFDNSLVSAVSITNAALFVELPHGTIDNANGLVDDFSGSHLGPCTDQIGVEPNWGRVAVIEMSADAKGLLTIQALDTSNPVYGTAICGVSDLDPASITFGSANMRIGDDSPIPTISEWGIVTMALLLLTVGALVFKP